MATNSTQLINQLQQNYGSAIYSQLQTVKRQFYSFVPYPTAGTPSLTFFGNAVGNAGTNSQFTNMPKAGSFGQRQFIVKAIRTGLFLNTYNLLNFSGTNASTFASDIVAGFAQAGYFRFTIGEKLRQELPFPFLYAPGGDGRPQVRTAGVDSLTLTTGTPNTLATVVSGVPWAEIATFKTPTSNAFTVDPQVMIEAEQNFQVNISFNSGVIPVISTGIVNDSTNPLYVGVILDGVEARPVQ